MHIPRLPGPIPDPKANSQANSAANSAAKPEAKSEHKSVGKPESKAAGPAAAEPAGMSPAAGPGRGADRSQDQVEALPRGEAVPCLSLDEGEELKVHYHKNGKIDISGFQPGNPPALADILKAAFPHAQKIEFVSSDHSRPFSTDFVNVDGRPYTASFLSGGFLPSAEYSIVPGHTREHFTPDDPGHTEVRPGTRRPHAESEPIVLKPFPGSAQERIPDPVLKPFPRQPEPLRAEQQPDGAIVVKGFAPGNPPPIEAVLKAAFPQAKSVEITGHSHMRPFDSYELRVDGKPFTASFLFGGIVASDQFSIRPGHGKAPLP